MSVRVTRDGLANQPLIPDIETLTELVIRDVSADATAAPMDLLVDGLASDFARKPNLEDMLTRLRTLLTVVGAATVRGLTISDIENLETKIVEAVAHYVDVDLPIEPTPYDDLAVWISAVERQFPISIFTTNYDLLTEQALERHWVPFFDGFVGSRSPFLDVQALEQDDIPSRWARLWKMHGSVHWDLKDDGQVVRVRPKERALRRMIHPSHLKYDESRRMPYLVMQDRLRSYLRAPQATLIVIGYSFGDQHINELLGQGLRANPSAAVFGLLFSQLKDYPSATDLASKIRNLGVFARDGGCLAGVTTPWSAEGSKDGTTPEFQLGDFGAFGMQLRQLGGSPVHGIPG